MSTSIQALRDALKVPERGAIDFRATLGGTLGEFLERWRKGHFPMPRHVVRHIDFDDLPAPAGSHSTHVIDSHYQATHGVGFEPLHHTYDLSTHKSGFEPMQAHYEYTGSGDLRWVEPHVWAVGNWGLPSTSQALSDPYCIVAADGEAYDQGMPASRAIRIRFDPAACAVRMGSNFKVRYEDRNETVHNWPQMLAFNEAGELLDQHEAPYGGELVVSSWAGDIASVIVTVNNEWAGPEPLGIFDDLQWTSIEFVLLAMKKLRDAPRPTPRGALADQVIRRIDALQRAQQRLHERLAALPAEGDAARLQSESAEVLAQGEALMRLYQRITRDTVSRSSAVPANEPA